MKHACLSALCLLAAALALPAAADITPCDRLAGHPSDPDKQGAGVPTAQVLEWSGAAIHACRQSLAEKPDDRRLRYNLGRVLYYVGQRAEALEHLKASAGAGHRQAQFVLGLLTAGGVEGHVPASDCEALKLWQAAAEGGHLAASLSLARNYARGTYASCPARPAPEAVLGYIAEARKQSSDYYLRLLADWAQETISRQTGASE